MKSYRTNKEFPADRIFSYVFTNPALSEILINIRESCGRLADKLRPYLSGAKFMILSRNFEDYFI